MRYSRGGWKLQQTEMYPALVSQENPVLSVSLSRVQEEEGRGRVQREARRDAGGEREVCEGCADK